MEELTPRQLLEQLVSFPTISTDSNLPMIDWVESYLAGHGIAAQRHWNEDRSKAALFAHVGPWQPGGVLLSGHSDVVPVAGQVWTSDPWRLAERNGRLYGRGTCDMKGYVALAIWALVAASKHNLRRPLQIALSYDEEVGCTGAPPMIETIQRLLPQASVALIGEPTGMAVINGHKGGAGYKVHVRGFEVHSSLLPSGVSAVMEAARLIHWLNLQNAANAAKPLTETALLFTPPFTTLHAGVIAGGTAANVTAAECRFVMEFRVLPEESKADWEAAFEAEVARIAAAMQAVRPESGIDLDKFFQVPALQPEPGGAAEALVRHLTGDNGSGVVSYGTEAGQFQEAGYSAVICGPGDIGQAHQADEYLEVAQFHAAHRFMQRLIEVLV